MFFPSKFAIPCHILNFWHVDICCYESSRLAKKKKKKKKVKEKRKIKRQKGFSNWRHRNWSCIVFHFEAKRGPVSRHLVYFEAVFWWVFCFLLSFSPAAWIISCSHIYMNQTKISWAISSLFSGNYSTYLSKFQLFISKH